MRISIPRKCDHSETITVVTAGIEQLVCQSCGAVKVRSADNDRKDTQVPAPEGVG